MNDEKLEAARKAERQRIWRAANPEKHTKARLAWREANRERVKRVQRAINLRHNFGITLADYQRLLGEQNGLCAICRRLNIFGDDGKQKCLAVDHCHSTGTIRGLLCHRCNQVLGYSLDSPETLNAAVAYLESSRSK